MCFVCFLCFAGVHNDAIPGAAEANFKWGGWRYRLMIFILVLIKHIHVHIHYCHIKYTCKLFKICQSIGLFHKIIVHPTDDQKSCPEGVQW